LLTARSPNADIMRFFRRSGSAAKGEQHQCPVPELVKFRFGSFIPVDRLLSGAGSGSFLCIEGKQTFA